MSDKKLDFRVNYKNLKIFEEFNSKDLRFPVVMSSPHSGRDFPPEFLANTTLSELELRSSEDSFVTEIVKSASDAGIPLLSMNIPRTFVDVNRDRIELDDKMFFDAPVSANSSTCRRCRVGLGVIHRIIYPNRNIYDGMLSYEEEMERRAREIEQSMAPKQSEKKDGKGNVIHSERVYGKFERSFDVSAVNEADISPSMQAVIQTIAVSQI